MRTPSIYSQDDPLSQAIKPSPTETETERVTRLAEEAEAKKISEKIDEDLRQEREKLKRNKGDVKVRDDAFHPTHILTFSKLLLLGQAESGKSTLQKQFQLLYKPNSLESERASWKMVIYFNVVRSLKQILTTLEAWEDSLDDVGNGAESMEESLSTSPSKHKGTLSEHPSPPSSLVHGASDNTGPSNSTLTRPSTATSRHLSPSMDPSNTLVANLRRRLAPLVATDQQLADSLSGGITVSGSGKGGVYVRSGWQTRTLDNTLGKLRPLKRAATAATSEDDQDQESTTRLATQEPLIQEVGHMLNLCKGDVNELWEHPIVRGLIGKRKLKLDEWSEL